VADIAVATELPGRATLDTEGTQVNSGIADFAGVTNGAAADLADATTVITARRGTVIGSAGEIGLGAGLPAARLA
jgi:hypothetical protein